MRPPQELLDSLKTCMEIMRKKFDDSDVVFVEPATDAEYTAGEIAGHLEAILDKYWSMTDEPSEEITIGHPFIPAFGALKELLSTKGPVLTFTKIREDGDVIYLSVIDEWTGEDQLNFEADDLETLVTSTAEKRKMACASADKQGVTYR